MSIGLKKRIRRDHELVFAHLFSMARFLFDSNRQMPLSGDSDFKNLKKYTGSEIRTHFEVPPEKTVFYISGCLCKNNFYTINEYSLTQKE